MSETLTFISFSFCFNLIYFCLKCLFIIIIIIDDVFLIRTGLERAGIAGPVR